MAESAVSFLIEYLGPLLVDEVKLLKGVRGDARKIRDELESMRAFLRDADAKEDTNESIKTWARQVRHAAYDTEAILDEFILHIGQYHPEDSRGILAPLRKMAHSIKKLRVRHRIGRQIQDMRSHLSEISKRKDDYGLNRTEQILIPTNLYGRVYDPRVAALFTEESEIVGIDEQRAKLFETYAWITVSETFKKIELLQNMITEFYQAKQEQAPSGLGAMTEIQLIQVLRDYLQGKRAFPTIQDNLCPPELLQLAQSFVKKCQGLPLAIVTLGGLLASKDQTYAVWDMTHRTLAWELENVEKIVFPDRMRRLSIQNKGSIVPEYKSFTHLRSLFIFGGKEPSIASALPSFSGLDLLRAVNIEGVPMESFPEHLTSLLHLRYLRLVNNNISGVPEIYKLQRLRNLYVSKQLAATIPGINKFGGAKVPSGVGSLRSLHELIGVQADSGNDPLKALGSLPNLLRLKLIEAYDGEELCANEGDYLKLKSLTLSRLRELRKVRVEKGAMPNIEILGVGECKALCFASTSVAQVSRVEEAPVFNASLAANFGGYGKVVPR
ncbi:hypothetical protein ACLOJK_019327 [Asimina triloba]